MGEKRPKGEFDSLTNQSSTSPSVKIPGRVSISGAGTYILFTAALKGRLRWEAFCSAPTGHWFDLQGLLNPVVIKD